MAVVAVDLAARYSATVALSTGGCVEHQFDSALCGETGFITSITNVAVAGFYGALIVEDLPHGVGYKSAVKRVCQIQGRIVDRMWSTGQLDMLIFVAPATWRYHYEPLRKQHQGMDAVIAVAADLGYTPPPLTHLEGPRGGRGIADKVQTDYCAAYLIGHWANDMHHAHGTYDVPGTNRYGKPTRRRAQGMKPA